MGIFFVIFDDISRLSRNVKDYHLLKVTIKQYGGIFISLKEDLESGNPMAEFQENMLIVLADFNRKQTMKFKYKDARKTSSWLLVI